ncbi:MAG: zinc ribbon domain-containing protein [Candidatus Poribacteria bacterium]
MPDFNLSQQLSTLYELQEVDTQIKKLDELKKSIPDQIEKLSIEFEKYKKRLQDKQDELEAIQKELRSKNRTLDTQQEQLKRYYPQRRSVKTEKEYNALEREINNLQKKNSILEDEILELLFSIDEVTEELKEHQTAYRAEKIRYEKQKNDLLLASEDFDRQIAEWTNKRSLYDNKIDPQLLKIYDEWRIRRGRFLLAPVVDNTCGGCNMTIPPQTINEVRQRKELINCGSCSRILYLPEEQEGQTES